MDILTEQYMRGLRHAPAIRRCAAPIYLKLSHQLRNAALRGSWTWPMEAAAWFLVFGPPNVPHVKLRGQGPRAFETSGAAAAAAPVSIRAEAVCSRRDTARVLFGRGASAPDRSRAVTASA